MDHAERPSVNPAEIQALSITQDGFTMRWKARGYVEGLGGLEAWGTALPTALAALQALAAQRVAELEGNEAGTDREEPLR